MCLELDRRMATPWASAYHAPVIADEVLGFVGDAAAAVDGTLGGGGHALAMLEDGVKSVVGIDRDAGAVAAARARLSAKLPGMAWESPSPPYLQKPNPAPATPPR